MNIITALEEYNGNKNLKVGSAAGFFYVGTVGDFIERFDYIDKEIRTTLVNKRKEKAAMKEGLLQRDVSINAYARRTRNPTLEGYIVSLTKWLEAVRSASQSVIKAERGIEAYVKLEKRNILRVYEADPAVEDNCLCVVIEGNEVGGYWTVDEGKSGSVYIKQEGADDEV